MDVITMRSTLSLIPKLAHHFSEIHFVQSDDFLWSPEKRTVFYDPTDTQAPQLVLHELGHAQLGHHDYRRDIQLLGMETEAWAAAKKLADEFEVAIDEEVVESHLDTYRDWLHDRSTCPECGAVGHQAGVSQYRCLACLTEWRVNEARTCQLRRYKLDRQRKAPR